MGAVREIHAGEFMPALINPVMLFILAAGAMDCSNFCAAVHYM
jgi:hypothetical protein